MNQLTDQTVRHTAYQRNNIPTNETMRKKHPFNEPIIKPAKQAMRQTTNQPSSQQTNNATTQNTSLI